MGAQNTKERAVSIGTHSARTARNRPRLPKDGRQLVSNIFTEHNGMIHSFSFQFYFFASALIIVCNENNFYAPTYY